MAESTSPLPGSRARPLKVSELNARVKGIIEGGLPPVYVEGEVTNYKPHRSGHHYFSLKDDRAKVACVLWKSDAAKLKFRLENGQAVVAYGTASLYEAWGAYQLYVDRIEPLGVGALQAAFEQMKKKLEAEGLFDAARKKPLPALPLLVGIVTSPDAAARRDIETTIQRRFPGMPMELFPVPVQGEGAAEKIAAAIREVNRARPDVEVLIVGRGGGSIEDLWAFNEEAVARAIAESKIPVISAVGHETDFTIADFVADVRAKTPTDAAVIAVPEKAKLLQDLDAAWTTLDSHVDHLVATLRERLDGFGGAYGLKRVPDGLAERARRLDEDARRLGEALRAPVERMRSVLAQAAPRLSADRLAERVRSLDRELDHRRSRLHDHGARAASTRRDAVKAAASRLEALSPLKILERGYTMTKDETGRVVTDASALAPGRTIRTKFRRGEASSTVTGVTPGD